MNLSCNIGYACINTLLSDKGITTNRSMIKKTFDQKGLSYASELALQNVQDLLTILKWNHSNGYKFFRLSSDIFPWNSEYQLEQLPDFQQIADTLKACGNYAVSTDQRLTFHPGPFNKLCSSDDRILGNTIKDLENHSIIFDLMGFQPSVYNKINIHVGAAYGDKEKTAETFCLNFEKLSPNCKARLTVENDDKASMFSTVELYSMIYKKINIPIVHDLHHHLFCDGGLSQQESLNLATQTWGDVRPVVHYSESRSRDVAGAKPQAHSDLIFNIPETGNHVVDIMVEAKNKEQASAFLHNRVIAAKT
jgi:UV DNA damage endonuclease